MVEPTIVDIVVESTMVTVRPTIAMVESTMVSDESAIVTVELTIVFFSYKLLYSSNHFYDIA